jgi:predicted Zn-dependent peptidase
VNLQQPLVGATKPGKLPAVIDTTLPNGLRVLAARKPGLPMVQVRLRIDVARSKGWGDGLIEEIAGQTIVTGTESRSQLEIADELRTLGAVMSTSVDSEDMYIAGTTVSTELSKYLSVLADVIQNATHPEDELALAKGQAEQGLAIAGSQPETRARYALAQRLFPGHPYGQSLPTPDLVAPITRAQVRKFQKTMVTPNAALIVLVGDMPPAKMVAAVDKAIGRWSGTRRVGRTPVPAPVTPGPIQVVHHPGAVQTSMRLGGIGVNRAAADFPALMLALVILGGGFTSRLNHNLREDKGYTYGAGAGMSHNLAATQITVSADVQTAVTAPAFVETMYELGRMATLPVSEDELAAAKRYIAGSLALSVQTQAGLASYLTTLAVAGLDVSFLRDLPLAADKLTVEDIAAASAKYLAPSVLAPVLLGDADQIADSVALLGASEVLA